jgi:hypothetical protein
MSARAEELARRVERGARDLIAAVQSLTDEQWRTVCGDEHRTVGVFVHHVGVMYPLEADVVTTLARDGGMPGLTWEAVHGINSEHATGHAGVDKETAVALVRENVLKAVEAVRALTDEQLDRVAPNGLHWDAPLTVQFFIEHHPIAHPYIHLESIRYPPGEHPRRARLG